MAEPRIAVLVDGDNIGAKNATRIRSEAARLGRIDIARVYAGGTTPCDWLTTPGYRFVHAGPGKNAADLLLSIDAIELALSSGIAAFAIATSDRDFTHLAQRLRERGAHVLGLGEAKAPEPFRMACSAFLTLEGGCDATVPADAPGACTAFDRAIRAMIAEHGEGRQGMRIARLSARMHAEHRTQISTRPEGTWRAYLAARPALYDLDPRGPEAMVRYRPAGFAAR